MSLLRIALLISFLFALQAVSQSPAAKAEVVSFPSGKLRLYGTLYKPAGRGPFPAVVYNHGSAPGMSESRRAVEEETPAGRRRY